MPEHSAMSIQDQVRRELAEFTDAERRVARALLGEYPMAGLETVARLARRAGTSGPTILRFVGRLGFDNHAAFQDALRSEIQARLQSPLARYDRLAEDAGDAPTPDPRPPTGLHRPFARTSRWPRRMCARILTGSSRCLPTPTAPSCASAAGSAG
ncbi:hypothetical protein RNZ50_06375 [Paracoccaceae bacterium Fryx2]|nr:hypothetical protein [Paracoccaceae bacterium Fryx2]